MIVQKIFERIYNSKTSQKYVKWAQEEAKGPKKPTGAKVPTNYDNLKDYVPIGLMGWLSLVQCGFFANSKKMPEDKKSSLIFNEVYTVALGVAISLASLKFTKKLTRKFVERAEEIYSKKSLEELKTFKNGIEIAVPAAFAITFCQYIAPVITAPLATKTTQYLIKQGKIKDPNTQNSVADNKLNVKA